MKMRTVNSRIMRTSKVLDWCTEGLQSTSPIPRIILSSSPTINMRFRTDSRDSDSDDLRTTDDEVNPVTLWKKDLSRVFHDVWYRRFLKPFAHCNKHSFSLQESFRQRVLTPVGIPLDEVSRLHEMFKPTHLHFSPLIGAIFTYNNFIDNLYRYGSPDEAAVILIRSLFHALPGGEIQTTHLGRCAGAHVSSSVIGEILELFEKAKSELELVAHDKRTKRLEEEIFKLISCHADYQASTKYLCDDIDRATQFLDNEIQHDRDSKDVRDMIKTIEGTTIKTRHHLIKRLEKELAVTLDIGNRERITGEIRTLQNEIEAANNHLHELRAQTVRSVDFKTAKKSLRRAQEMVEFEKDSRVWLAKTLTDCFLAYDWNPTSELTALPLPRFSTLIILLAFLWRKYVRTDHLRGYLESMSRLGALIGSKAAVKEYFDREAHGQSTCLSMTAPKALRRHLWSAKEKATAAVIIISKPGETHRPPIVQFSYVRWASYSKFPDCGETALRNLFNQVLYNPASGLFDYQLLHELRDRWYPLLSQKLIDFYVKYPHPEEVSEYNVSSDWIAVISNLNAGGLKTFEIRYHRKKQQENIASPLSNLLCAWSSLFGVDTPFTDSLENVVCHVNKLRGWALQIDYSGIKQDGFGRLEFSDGKVRYEVQSYKPVHFGFVQIESLRLDPSNRRNYEVFRRLMRYINRSNSTTKDASEYVERLALASLILPYTFQFKQRGDSFERYPPHHRILFADLYKSRQKKIALQWAHGKHLEDNVYLKAFADRVVSYEESSFLPIAKSK